MGMSNECRKKINLIRLSSTSPTSYARTSSQTESLTLTHNRSKTRLLYENSISLPVKIKSNMTSMVPCSERNSI